MRSSLDKMTDFVFNIKLSAILLLAGFLVTGNKDLLSQTAPNRIIINYPNSLDFHYFDFELLQSFKSEQDLISGSGIFSYLSDTFRVTVHYDPKSLCGSYIAYNKEQESFGAAFILSDIKEKRTGDSLSYYRDILRDGHWFHNTTKPDLFFTGIFDKGELLSQSLYKGDTLLEGGHYKNGKPIGEWVETGKKFFIRSYYDYNSNHLYTQVITLSDRKIAREYYRELLEKTTTLPDLSTPVTFWYIIDYNKQGTIGGSGHYLFSITNTPVDFSPDWDYIPYGIHHVYENGKVTKKKYKEMPKEIKYRLYHYDPNGNSYKTDYVKKLN